MTHDAGAMAGRTALVVGASTGIGAAVADVLLAAGARVHGAARRPVDRWTGGPATSAPDSAYVRHVLDVTDPSAVRAFCAELTAGADIDAVVIAAGTNVPNRRLDELRSQDWDQLLAVNLTGPFHVAQCLREHLRRTRGDVVLVSSVSALWPDLSGAAYQAAKAGLLAFARAYAAEEHSHGVRVTTVLPGVVDTPLMDKRPEPPSAAQREHFVQPEDVAVACLTALTLPRRSTIAEMTILPSLMQSVGHTNRPLPDPR